jgi:hypothetical protein
MDWVFPHLWAPGVLEVDLIALGQCDPYNLNCFSALKKLSVYQVVFTSFLSISLRQFFLTH